MTARDDALAATVERLALTQRAVVYTGTSWQTQAKTGLKCSFTPASRLPASTGGARTELARSGTLEWERGYTMPANARVEIDAYPGIRWAVQRGTDLREVGIDNGTLNWTAEVTRVLT